ncbi:MAG: WecB/TagA/CpsF family glycosyltransferase [Patescibacteria group bacterium]
MKKTYSKISGFEKNMILGTGFSDVNLTQVLEYIREIVKKDHKNRYFVTPNPELVMLAKGDTRYKRVLNDADLALTDGVGVLLAGKALKTPVGERITGVDLIENVCKDNVDQPITVGFLGGGSGVAEITAECLLKKYPGLKIGLVHEGNPDTSTLGVINEKTKNEKLDILFVAFGSPKQELWIAENLQSLPAKITIGVGGAFDFISGKVKRAPKWMQDFGLEWFFRLLNQPWRIKRQFSLIIFIFLVLKELIAKKK